MLLRWLFQSSGVDRIYFPIIWGRPNIFSHHLGSTEYLFPSSGVDRISFPIIWGRPNSFMFLSPSLCCPLLLPPSVPHFSYLYYPSLSTCFSVFLSISFLEPVHLPFFLAHALPDEIICIMFYYIRVEY